MQKSDEKEVLADEEGFLNEELSDLEKNAKVILMSHLGRVKTLEDKTTNTLEPVAFRLSELLNKEVIFVDETHPDSRTYSSIKVTVIFVGLGIICMCA